ncbi:efflux transporter outer membrane subunit [Pelagicoccus albus]|uniref:Efflux transporter outer membrane subunit n=1 Tax=Pelagicoccus albus TaxID=415222 RepID=A0A7X1BA74_9BACT|nr:efflux transporter outer membrane subunit [Pelagicoccus albus]MBC2607258.1 efflux transporter outer membrane subunit [Pelagicoccus albus]
MKPSFIFFPIAASALFLAGCETTSSHQSQLASFESELGEQSYSISSDSSQSADALDWWKSFSSEELNTLMDEALAYNHELQAGVERIAQARAELAASKSTLWPSLSASGSASRQRQSVDGSGSSYSSSIGAGIGLDYTVDIWGSEKASRQISEIGLLTQTLTEESLRLTIMGEVANGYFATLAYRDRLANSDQTLEILKETLDILEARMEAGRVSELEVAQQRSAVATAEASRASLATNLQTSMNALATLLGRYPGELEIDHTDLSGIELPSIAFGQPSELLERRPDLAASEQRLIAAGASVEIAKAARLPSLNLGADSSLSRAGFDSPTQTALSLAAGITAPLFQGGRLKANQQLAEAQQRELLETYYQEVLEAFREVEDALASVQGLETRESALRRAWEEAQTSFDLSNDLFESGRIDFQTLLDAQRSYLSAQDTFLAVQYDRLAAAVELYRTLGGGWQSS